MGKHHLNLKIIYQMKEIQKIFILEFQIYLTLKEKLVLKFMVFNIKLMIKKTNIPLMKKIVKKLKKMKIAQKMF